MSQDHESAARDHLIIAERRAAKVDGLSPGTKPRPIGKVGVIGAGTMGGGIAMSVINAGLPCVLLDATRQGLDAGLAKVRANYAISVQRGSRTNEQVAAVTALLSSTLDYDEVEDCDIVIEAAFEDMAVKKAIFDRLDGICKAGAILATNTSALNIDEIASTTSRPGDVIGTHFFSPANVMKLCEVVRGARSSDETIASAMVFATTIGKVPVLADNCEGFIGNRMLRIYGQEADLILEQGATPWQVDSALKQFGFPMGLYLMRDMSGLDVGYRMRQGRIEAGTLNPNISDYAPLADRLVEAGRLGQKTSSGFYKYAGRDATPDPEVEAMLAEIRKQKDVASRTFTEDEIVRQILSAMVNEGAKILEEGIAQRASDIDVTYVYGYGFPKHRGGPMFWASREGLDKIAHLVRDNYAALGERWRPAPLLEARARTGRDWDGEPAGQTAAL